MKMPKLLTLRKMEKMLRMKKSKSMIIMRGKMMERSLDITLDMESKTTQKMRSMKRDTVEKMLGSHRATSSWLPTELGDGKNKELIHRSSQRIWSGISNCNMTLTTNKVSKI